MIRPDYELHQLPVSEWSPSEALSHLKRTFDAAAIKHPDLMEPYVILAGEADYRDEPEIMRLALKHTFQARHPRSLKPYQEGE